MNISIVGTGYVGLCTGIGFAMKGSKVICVDIDAKKIENINKGIPPIYEKGLEQSLKKCLKDKTFSATTDLDFAINNSDTTFIAVGTPSKKDGNIDLVYVETASRQIGAILKAKKSYHVIVVKSTVVPGTTEDVVIPLLEKHSNKKAGMGFGVCANPEFLREGYAIEDFINPDRIVIGEYDKKSGDLLEKVYTNFNAPIIRTNLKTAEMAKYAGNAFRPAKISMINEIGNICKSLGIDVYDVARTLGYDKVIGPHFLNAGVGFGGSCFSKDATALINKARELGYEPKLLSSILEFNKKQRLLIVDILKTKISVLKNKKIAVLGLAFKSGTDDVRDSPAIEIIKKLLDEKAVVSVYDPKAMDGMKKIIPNLNYEKSVRNCLDGADACLILTDWDEFRLLTDRDFSVMKSKIIIEGRKTLDRKNVKNFEGICW